MKQVLKRTIITGAALALLGSPAAVFAHDGMSHDDEDSMSMSTTTESPSPSETPKPERVRQLEDSLRSKLEKERTDRTVSMAEDISTKAERLEGAKKKACENHVSTINRLKSVMDKRRANVLERITKIAGAVQAFKTKKDVQVENYDELLAKVAAAKSVAESSVEAQQQVPSLNCDGERPKADMSDFKDKRSASIEAVKEYRDAVKELVKAVKAALDAVKEASPSPTTDGGNQ